jgi:hypothetical protein
MDDNCKNLTLEKLDELIKKLDQVIRAIDVAVKKISEKEN